MKYNVFFCGKNYNCCNYKYADKLDDLPTEDRECDYLIEAEPVIHARWDKVPLKKHPNVVRFQCSTCDCSALAEYNYCPHCGAKMDEK